MQTQKTEQEQIMNKIQKLLIQRRSRELFVHQIESYENMVKRIVKFFQKDDNYANYVYPFKSQKGKNTYFVKISYNNVRVTEPMYLNERATPDLAFKKSYTYSMDLIVDSITLTKIEIEDGVIKAKQLCEYKQNNGESIQFTQIPVMVKSNYCSIENGYMTEVDESDPGCYFITNGQEKVVKPIERSANDRILIYMDKKNYVAQVISQAYDEVYTNKNMFKIIMKDSERTMSGKMKGVQLIIETSQFAEVKEDSTTMDSVSVFTFLTALGIQDDEQLFQICTYGDQQLAKLFKVILASHRDSKQGTITNQLQAIQWLDDYKTKKMEHKDIIDIISTDILPHIYQGNDLIPNFRYKAYFIGLMINKLLNTYIGNYQIQSRDIFLNKRVITTGDLIYELFEQSYRLLIKNVREQLFKLRNFEEQTPQQLQSIINQMIQKNTISKTIIDALKTGKWSQQMKGISSQLPTTNIVSKIGACRQINSGLKSQQSTQDSRNVDVNQIGFYCPIESPDGKNVGVHKHLALSCQITIFQYEQKIIILDLLKDYLEQLKCQWFDPMHHNKNKVLIILQGIPILLSDDIILIHNFLRQKRFENKINKFVSFSYDQQASEYYIYLDGGRLIRPLIVVNEKQEFNITLKQINEIKTFEQLLEKYPNCIEFIDQNEQITTVIAQQDPKYQLTEQKQNNDQKYIFYTHCELDKMNMFGILANNVCYVNCNQGPRAVFGFVQMKRGIQKAYKDFKNRNDIGYILIEGEQPIVQSQTSSLINLQNNPMGHNCVVAVTSIDGFQQEDSITVNGRIVRTAYQQCKQDTIVVTFTKKQTFVEETLEKPNIQIRKTNLNYDKVGEDGMPIIGKMYGKDDVILCKVVEDLQYQANGNNQFKQQFRDQSTVSGYNSTVIIKDIKKVDEMKQYKIIIKILIPLWCNVGDKVAARCGQKGTVSTTKAECQMLFTESGQPIDLIINPHSFSKRMTVAYQIEIFTSLLAIYGWQIVDSTCFADVYNQFVETVQCLQKQSLNEKGLQNIYNPQNGKCIGQACVGIVFYSFLEQKATAKLYVTGLNEATKNPITRHPKKGRKKEGGLRLGEMEFAAILSAGLSNVINCFAKDHSDGVIMYICECGNYCVMDKNQGIYVCRFCDSKMQVYKTSQQYSTFLLNYYYNAFGVTQKLSIQD